MPLYFFYLIGIDRLEYLITMHIIKLFGVCLRKNEFQPISRIVNLFAWKYVVCADFEKFNNFISGLNVVKGRQRN